MDFTLKALINSLAKLNRIRQFVYDFDYYDGTETDNNKCIADENVYQYEFWNQGSTVCVINDMNLRPEDRIVLDIYNREKDVQVYKYYFIPICIQTGQSQFTVFDFQGGDPTCTYSVQLTVGGENVNTPFTIDRTTTDVAILNLLIANLLPTFQSANWQVFYTGTDLNFFFSDLVLPCDHLTAFGVALTNNGGLICPLFIGQEQEHQWIQGTGGFNKLLVISKLPADRRKSNLGL